MLAIPVPKKHHKSFSFILNKLGLKNKAYKLSNIAVQITLTATTFIVCSPIAFNWRTKIPVKPQKIPAIIIKTGARRRPKSLKLSCIVYH